MNVQNALEHAEDIRRLMASFYRLTRVRMSFFTEQREEIIDYPSGQCAFCRRLRQDPEMNRRCQCCDQRAFDATDRMEGVNIYDCHAGLTEAIVAFRHNGRPTGYLMIGQFLSDHAAYPADYPEELLPLYRQQTVLEAAALHARLEAETLDVTIPGKPVEVGHKHPMYTVLDEIKDIFIGKGNYNQELYPQSILLEFGTHTSDKEQVLTSTAYMADVINVAVFGASPGQSQKKDAQNAAPQQAETTQPEGPKVSRQSAQTETGGRSGIWTAMGWIVGIVLLGGLTFGLVANGGFGGFGERVKRFSSEVSGGLFGKKPKE